MPFCATATLPSPRAKSSHANSPRGHDRLAGKKIVIWGIGLARAFSGNWKLLPMKLGQPVESHFFSPKAGDSYLMSGTVQSVSPVPLPGSVPYKDHILTVHLTDLAPDGMGLNAGKNAGGGVLQALVYLTSMHDNVWTPAARLRAGDQVKVRVRAWSDVSASTRKSTAASPTMPPCSWRNRCGANSSRKSVKQRGG